MIFLGIIFVLGLISTGLWLTRNKPASHHDRESRIGGAIRTFVFTMIMTVFLIINQCVNWQHHIDDIESLEVIHEETDIYKKRSDNIKAQVAEVLVDKYTEHESGIFDKISGDGIGIYLVKYPELHSHETFSKYADILIDLEDKIYAMELKEVSLRKDISIRERSILILPWFLPDTE